MLNVADLVYKTEYQLVKHLNVIMEPAGLSAVYHVSDAVNRASSKSLSVAEKDARELALNTFFTEIAGEHAQKWRQQWLTCVKWMRVRASVVHPVSCNNQITRARLLRQLHVNLQHTGYGAVREVAKAMVACLARMWNISLRQSLCMQHTRCVLQIATSIICQEGMLRQVTRHISVVWPRWYPSKQEGNFCKVSCTTS